MMGSGSGAATGETAWPDAEDRAAPYAPNHSPSTVGDSPDGPTLEATAQWGEIVVIPRTPGRVLRIPRDEEPSGDELDALVDDIFGPPTDERPGRFDAVLVIVGVGLVAWSVLGSGSTVMAVAGVVAVLLGIALPARTLLRTMRSRGLALETRRVLGSGFPIDVSTGTPARLVTAYEDLVAMAGAPGSRVGQDVLDAAHRAVVEAALLLKGRPPIAREQSEYVDRRARAIAQLVTDVKRADRRRFEPPATLEDEPLERRRARAAAVTIAREELEADDVRGSLHQLDRYRRALARELGDDDTDAG